MANRTARDCLDCPWGAICRGGAHVAAAPGYWQSLAAHETDMPDDGEPRFYRCVATDCCVVHDPGSVCGAELIGCNSTSPLRCEENRDNFWPLCGRCLAGYSEWGGQCVPCPARPGGTQRSYAAVAVLACLVLLGWSMWTKVGVGAMFKIGTE